MFVIIRTQRCVSPLAPIRKKLQSSQAKALSVCQRHRSSSAADGVQQCGIYVSGAAHIPRDASFFEVRRPFDGALVAKCVDARPEDVSLAVQAAHDAFVSGVWSKADVRLLSRHRAAILQNIAEKLRVELQTLATLEVQQIGRPIREMRAQLGRLPEWFEYFAALIRVSEGRVPPFFGPYLNYVQRVPLGVCAQLTPWNHPLLIAIKKLAPALAAGNSVVLKPSELAPISVLRLAEICVESGLPPNVFNIVTGQGPSAGAALCAHPLVRKIDLTGGTATGRLVAEAAGRNLSGVVAELGGKGPTLVFADADIIEAVNGAAFGSFVASGQTCITSSRLLLHQDIADEFLKRFVAKTLSLKFGDPRDMNTHIGPVISHKHRARIHAMVQRAVQDGALLLAGGHLPDSDSLPAGCQAGSYYPLTVLGGVRKDMEIFQEEVFGPVVAVSVFADENDAIALANATNFALGASVWTRDFPRAHRVCSAVDAGILWVNDHHRNDPSSPWGGMRHSGLGRENGLDAWHEYTQSKSVVVRTDNTPFDWFVATNARYS